MSVLLPRFEGEVVEKMGRLLKEARVAAGLRQRDLAAKIGASPPTVGAMESGNGGRVSLSRWVAAFNALGMLQALIACLDSVEVDPFARAEIEMSRKKKQRVRVRRSSKQS